MIKVTVGNNVKREAVIIDENRVPSRKHTKRFRHRNRTKQATHRRALESADRCRKQNRYSADDGCP